jgi:hypothetical protein
MTMDRFSRVERTLPGLFADLADARTPDYLEAAIERASDRPQRPSWTFPERWLPVELVSERVPTTRMPWRQLGVVALIALLLGAMLAVYIGSQHRAVAPPYGLAVTCGVTVADHGTLFMQETSGGGRRALYTGATKPELDGLISGDGTKVAVVTGVAEIDETISVVPADGGPPVVIPGGPFTGLHGVTWSPQSDELAITADIASPDGKVTQHLILARADGSGSKVIEPGFAIGDVTYRPTTGDELIASATIGGKDTLVMLQRDGSIERILPPPPAAVADTWQGVFGAAFSPDGRQLAYQAFDRYRSINTLWVGPADAPEKAAEVGSDLPRWAVANEPAWSNGGDRIAIQRATDDGLHLAIYDAVTRKLHDIGDAAGKGWPAVTWSPDDATLLLLPADGGLQLQIDPTTGRTVPTSWSAVNYPSFRRCA